MRRATDVWACLCERKVCESVGAARRAAERSLAALALARDEKRWYERKSAGTRGKRRVSAAAGQQRSFESWEAGT